MSLRSSQEDRPSLEKVEPPLKNLPEAKTEAQSLQAKVSSTDPAIVEGSPRTQTQGKKGTENYVLLPYAKQDLEVRIAQAEAWEVQASEAERRRSNQIRTSSLLEMEDTTVLQKPSLKKMEVSEMEKSKVVSTRPRWSSKAEYILALVGFSLRAINLWRFPHLWLHNGGCKSGDQESWNLKGLARQRLIQASDIKVSGTGRSWRLGTLSRIGANCLNSEGGEMGRDAGYLNRMVG